MDAIQFSGSANVILETVKRGEDDSDVTSTPIKKRDSSSVILRIYEAYGGRGTAEITTFQIAWKSELIVVVCPLRELSRRISLRMTAKRLIPFFTRQAGRRQLSLAWL